MKDKNPSAETSERDEPEPDFKHYAMLRISSELGLDLDRISSTLGVTPTSIRSRGIKSGSHGRPSAADVWMYQPMIAEEASLHQHIDALWMALKPHAEFIRCMKADATVAVLLGYLSRLESAGVSIPHRSLEMFQTLELDFELYITVIADE